MNASNAFRSHLMQQFALTARGQSRPPLAMMPWMKDDGDNNKNNNKNNNNNKETKKKKRSTRTARTAAGEDARAFEFSGSAAASTLNHHHSTSTSRSLSSAAWSLSAATSAASVVTSGPGSTTTNSPVTNKIPPLSQRRTQSGASSAFSSAALLSLTEDDHHDEQKYADRKHHDLPTGLVAEEPLSEDSCHARTAEKQRLASQFQTMIHTRRTTSHFAPPPSSIQQQQQDTSVLASEVFWKGALDRAVACGRRAPNHKRRTEAYSFKRMVSPSGATERLAEICYRVTLQKTNSEIHAKKKQLKWRNIPAFLVAILGRSDQKDEDHHHHYADSIREQDKGNDMYEPLPFVPIQTEGEMNDYASTCAAVQNVLLSLHSENIASKWATGPVVHTRAFRELVGATHPGDRIVALIMIGLPQIVASSEENSTLPASRQRRFRRDWDEYLQDLE